MSQHILVVDDDYALAQAIREWLREAGYRVTVAQDGRTGLSLAQSQLPDLIVLDVKMPDLDGWQVLQALHEHETTAEIPVLLLTACDDPDSIHKGYELGCTWFYTKPIVHPDHLLLIIRRILGAMGVGVNTAPAAAANQPQTDPCAS